MGARPSGGKDEHCYCEECKSGATHGDLLVESWEALTISPSSILGCGATRASSREAAAPAPGPCPPSIGIERLTSCRVGGGPPDASILPDVPSGFTQLPTIMFTERLSEQIVSLL